MSNIFLREKGKGVAKFGNKKNCKINQASNQAKIKGKYNAKKLERFSD